MKVVHRSIREHGFSLIEVLVAFSIMALALGVLYQALGGSLRAAGEAERYVRAVLVAESILSQYDSVPPEGLDVSGAAEGFDWHLRTAPVPPLNGHPEAWTLQNIEVEVSWEGHSAERRFRLVTVRPEVEPVIIDINAGGG